MFKRIFFVLVVFVFTFHLNGYSQISILRNKLNQSTDSEKPAILLDMARLYETRNPDSCLFYAQKAAEISRKNQQTDNLIEAGILSGRAAFHKKDYTRAGRYQKEALDISAREKNWSKASLIYYDLGQTWLSRNNYAEAVDNLKKGMQITSEQENPELLKDYYQSLISAYQKLRNVDAVSEYYTLLMELNRKTDAEAHHKQIASLQEQVSPDGQETVTSEKPNNQASPMMGGIIIWAILATLLLAGVIIFYRYRITVITNKKQDLLDATNYELDSIKQNQGALFRFLTQYAYSSIDSLHKNIEEFTYEQGANRLPAVDNTLSRINNEVFALYGFFQNFLLLLQAQSGQLAPQLAAVNVPQLATNLLADYESFASANDIQLVNDVQNNVYALADERLIDIVLRNMMSNAFKYAPKNGLITLGAKENYQNVEIWVTDDGIGLTPEQSSKLFDLSDNISLPGNPNTKGFGLGLAVCKALIDICKGEIWSETKPNEGFCIRFSLPKAEVY